MTDFSSFKAKLFDIRITASSAVSATLRQLNSRFASRKGPVDLLLCLVDHFEPQAGKPSRELAMERVSDWAVRYPEIARRHQDADGQRPAHSFFYPWDEFHPDEFAVLRDLCSAGWGEIELHLHHRDDTEESLRAKLREAIDAYQSYGALSRWADHRPAFGFIHGNWALNNSRHDHGRNYCGVNDEIRILKEEGCYADFTFPSWHHRSQPRLLNQIYRAESRPDRPKGHDSGRIARAGQPDSSGLPLIQGPLVPYLRNSKIRMEDGDLASYQRYHPDRFDRWASAGIGVKGEPDRVFIKLHTHGAPEKNRAALLDGDLDALFSDAEARFNDGERYRLHYVTAREMFNIVQATIEGAEASIRQLRNYALEPPPYLVGGSSATSESFSMRAEPS